MSLAVTVPVDSTDAPVDSLTTSAPVDSVDTPVTEISHERVTKFTLGGGGGRYYRELLFPFMTECGTANEMVPFEHEYNDVGAELDFQIDDLSHVGIRAGYIWGNATLAGPIDTVIADAEGLEDLEVIYFNPYFSFEWDWVGLGAGAVLSSYPLQTGGFEDYPIDDNAHIYPSLHLRFGTLSRFYVSGHAWESVPIYSGGGTLMGGAGLRPVRWLELYGAYCGPGPYQEEAWLGRVTIDINQSWTLTSTLRFPVNYQPGSEDEHGVSAGLSYRHYRNQH
jgi:hypothetical protein